MENKTAVEWLYEEIKHIIPENYISLFQQAIELEKGQRESEFERGYLKCASDLDVIIQKGLKYDDIKRELIKRLNKPNT